MLCVQYGLVVLSLGNDHCLRAYPETVYVGDY